MTLLDMIHRKAGYEKRNTGSRKNIGFILNTTE